jgi:predicted PurR-regulated permease PerM
VHWLQRRGLGRLAATLAVVGAGLAIVTVCAWVVLLQLQTLAGDLPAHRSRILERIETLQNAGRDSSWAELSDVLQDIGQQVKQFGVDNDGGATEKPLPVTVEPSWQLPVLQSAAMPVVDTLASAGLVVVLVAFMLFGWQDLRSRIVRLWGRGSVTRLTKALDDAGNRISRFLQSLLLINASFGAAAALGLLLLGLPYALLWGFMAATLRFIPYIGGWVAALSAIALSIVLSPNWTQPVLIAVLFIVLELINDFVLEPLLYGHSIGVSIVAFLVAAAFWGWLWGPVGLLLAMPLTACLVVLGRHVPQLESLAILLGDEPPLEPHVSFFQRVLARDQDEAADIVESYAADHSSEETYERVLLPALVLAKESRERGEFTPEDEQQVYRITGEVLEELWFQGDESARRAAANEAANGEGDPDLPVVLGCPTGDRGEELALQMLGHLLHAAPCRFQVLSAETLSGEVTALVRQQRPAAVCLAFMPSQGFAHVRFLCKRLRSSFPELQILVGCWGLMGDVDHARERLLHAGASDVHFGLVKTRDALLALTRVCTTREPDARHARTADRTTAKRRRRR